MPLVDDVCQFLERFAPPVLAETWDNVGLLLGERSADVRRALTCLTLTPDVAEEAIGWEAGLVVSHHPILFRPVQRLTDESAEGRMLLRLIRAGVSVYSPHTAFDGTRAGINDQLAEALELEDVRPLRPVEISEPGASEAEPDAGTGRFGRCGETTLGEFVRLVQERLPAPGLRYTGEDEWPVRLVGLGCGSAGELLRDARAAGCDVFLTGETRFHTCLEARTEGVGLVLVGHYASERPAVERLAEVMGEAFGDLEVRPSRVECDPSRYP